MKNLTVIFSLLILTSSLNAQDLVQRFDGIPVTINGEFSQVPFDGGRDNPRIQFLDIDGDGLLDLFMYDKDTSLYFYKNTGTPTSPKFTLITKRFQNLSLKNWFFFVDVNNNGVYDLFSGSPDQKIFFFRNSGTPTNPQFNLEISELRSTGDTVIFQDANSVPNFFDENNNGMKDMFLGSVSGTITLYRNVSTANEVRFEFVTDFWQNILIIGKADHGANSFDFADLNNNGLYDLYWGDLFNPSIYTIINTGTPGNPNMNLVDSIYPQNDPVYTFGFNSPRFADLNGNGLIDLYVTVLFISQTRDNFIYFENTGTQSNPQFVRRTNNYLTPLDVGSNSNPVFADINGSGLDDIIIGSTDAKLHLYENTGTASHPEFTFVTDSIPISISSFNFNLSPSIADLDGNGTLDLMVGSFLRDSMWYFSNTGTPQNPQFTFQGTAASLGITNLGQSSTPAFVDIDGDGDLDLFVGNWNGRIHYYRNDGSPQSPSYTYITNFYDSIDVGDESVPRFLDLEGNGTYDMFIGSRQGKIWYYRNDGTPQNPSFTFVTDNYKDINAFSNAAPTWVDIDNDGDPDLFIGNIKGGLLYYQNNDIIGIEVISTKIPEQFNLYQNFPNPFNPSTKIKYDLQRPNEVTLQIFDISGKLISTLVSGNQQAGSYQYTFNADGLSSGAYIYRLTTDDFTQSKRMVYLK